MTRRTALCSLENDMLWRLKIYNVIVYLHELFDHDGGSAAPYILAKAYFVTILGTQNW